MKLKEEIKELLLQPMTGHPSRKDQQKIKRLEKIVLLLAEKIDQLDRENSLRRPFNG